MVEVISTGYAAEGDIRLSWQEVGTADRANARNGLAICPYFLMKVLGRVTCQAFMDSKYLIVAGDFERDGFTAEVLSPRSD